MKEEIRIEVKSVYGILKVYPLCRKAKLFAKIAKSTTLTHETLQAIEELGYFIRNEETLTTWKDAK